MIRPDSRTARIRPTRLAAVVGAMIGAVAIAGCGAGQISQTADQVPAVNGAHATAGTIAVRNAQFEFDTAANGAAIYPAGTSAPLEMSIVNTGGEPDRLVAASSPIAENVEIIGNAEVPGGQSLVVEGAPAEALAPPAPGATGAPEATGTPEATDTPGTTPETPGSTGAPDAPATPGATEAPSPAPGAIGEESGTRTASVVLTGLRQDLQVGPTYPVVLTFERAGDVQLSIPVGNPDVPRQDAH